MAVPKQKMREVVFLLLYCLDLSAPEEDELVKLVSNELKVAKSQVKLCLSKVRNIQSHQKEIDEKVASALQSYRFERIHWVERNILRLGLYEMFFDEMIPPKVAIAEAIRLGKKFGTPPSVAFINAIMDHLFKLSIGEGSSSAAIEESIEDLIVQDEILQETIEKHDTHTSPIDPDRKETE